jgi:HK97 gp10 family phage protein
MANKPRNDKKTMTTASGTVSYAMLWGTIYDRVTFGYYRRLRKAGDWMKKQVQQMIGKPFPPSSAEGEPPHRRSGNLQRSITIKFSKTPVALEVKVGSKASYAMDLEMGTSKVPARPFLRPANDKFGPKAIKMANRGKLI